MKTRLEDRARVSFHVNFGAVFAEIHVALTLVTVSVRIILCRCMSTYYFHSAVSQLYGVVG